MEDKTNTSATVGKLFLGWAVVLFIGMVIAQQFMDKKHNPNASPRSQENAYGQQEVVLKRNAYGHYVTNGKINGKDVTFMLDTGATSVSIPKVLASQLQLETGYGYEASTANGVIKVYSTTLDTVSIGDIQLNNIHGSLNPYQAAEDEILLGMSFLKHLELVQRNDILILRY